MNQYKIEVYRYTETGSPTNEKVITRYCETVEQARNIIEEYDKQKYVNEDGSQGFKMYQTKLYVLCYKQVTDKTSFFANFDA